MPDYRRYRKAGGTYFFTINLLERTPNDLLVRPIGTLRQAIRDTRKRWPFHIDACVVLPDHMRCVWTLPEGMMIIPTVGVLLTSLFESIADD